MTELVDDDPLLDVLLSEALGHEQPPDLTARILAAAGPRPVSGYEVTIRELDGQGEPTDPSGIYERPDPETSVSVIAQATRPSSANLLWFGFSIALSLVAALGTYIVFRPAPAPTIADAQVSGQPSAGTEPVSRRQMLAPSIATGGPGEAEGGMLGRTRPLVVPPAADFPQSHDLADSHDPTLRPLSPGAEYLNRPAREEIDDREVIAAINEQLRWQWKNQGIEPTSRASEGEWCRRVYLDVIGRIPTVEELSAYLDVLPAERTQWLIDRLLTHEDYRVEYAENWAAIWSNLLIGRGMSSDAPGVSREGLRQWLRRAMAENLSYDEFVVGLLTATGTNTPGSDDFNGSVNFLLDHMASDQVPATNKVAELFLGTRVGCTQCHNHPFNHWKQDQFWGLNAFFKQTHLEYVSQDEDTTIVRLLNQDFVPSSGNMDEAEIYYELRNGLLKVAYPKFLDGSSIDPSGELAVVNRRDELARLVAGSPNLAEAEVNRLWAHFFGYGFTKPIDDLGPHNRPSHPELFSQLAEWFRKSGYDRRRLIRWLVLSDAYLLSSRIQTGNEIDAPDAGEMPLFSRFYLRQMSPEQLYDSLLTAAGLHDEFAVRFDERGDWMQQFIMPFETEENTEASLFSGSITQTLSMMNGELMERATEVRPGTFLHHVHTLPTTPRAKIELLYLAALSRRPTIPEAHLAEQLWTARRTETVSVLQDIWWALLNSNEFIMNH